MRGTTGVLLDVLAHGRRISGTIFVVSYERATVGEERLTKGFAKDVVLTRCVA